MQVVEGKLPDGQEPAAVDVDYVLTCDLQPLDSATLNEQLQVTQHLHLRTVPGSGNAVDMSR